MNPRQTELCNNAVDYARFGIRANAICPGTVPTPLVLDYYRSRGEITDDIETGLAMTRKRFPLGRHGTVEDMAALAAYLAADESGYVTGALIPIDGGLSAKAWLFDQ